MNLVERVVNAVQNAVYGPVGGTGEATRAALGATFGAWEVAARGRRCRVYKDATRLNKFALDATLADLSFESVPESGVFDGDVDMTIQRVQTAVLDGWAATVAGWHYALGQPGGKVTDGWVGFGGRRGAHWLLTRLVRVGYLHWPTRTWDDIGGAPTYNRNNLGLTANAVTLPTLGETLTVEGVANWTGIWTTPGGGRLDIRWKVRGGMLKEEITINQAARTWVANNRPPGTPLDETWFGFVFALDIAGIHQFLKDGVWQNMMGDWDDGGVSGVEMRNALGALIGFMPVGKGYVVQSGDVTATVGLRRRFWLDGDGNVYLLLGVRCDQLVGLGAGALVFDPTIDTQVSAGDRDAHEGDNNANFSSVSTQVRCESHTSTASRFNAGHLFTLTGPVHGDTVDVAYLAVRAVSTSVDDPNVDIAFENVDAAVDFATNADVTARARTASSVQWTTTGIGTGEVQSPSIVTPLQAVWDRAGFAGGNVVALLDGRSDIVQAFRTVGYESVAANAAKLHVEYTVAVVPGAGGGLPLRGVGL